ncbi:MAG: transposase family protein [Propionibacteriaceae bacterium]|nr:MAG: transposase family protein [Propionibacteriaceae bacterium]
MLNPVIYRAVLPLSRATVTYIAELLHRAQQMRGTRRGRRRLGPFDQAVLFCRWLLDAVRIRQLAVDNAIGLKTAYRYVHETLDVLAVQVPSLVGALLAARAAGHSHVMIDGTLIATDRVSVKGPTAGVDLWWSGKHHHHGGNVQVITAPDGWPIWVSPVRPGREHDTTCARTHPGLLDSLEAWRDDEHAVLADLGYEGERGRLTCPVKHVKGQTLTDDEACVNALHSATRAVAERGNSLLKNTFKALKHVTLCPWRIGVIVAAALVVLHREHHRTT